MFPLSQEQKHQVLVQLRSSISTHKVAALVGMNQSSIVHMRKDARDKIERQIGACPKLFVDQEKRRCVTFVNEGQLGAASMTTKQL